jgi:hypothetical protein
MPKIIRGRFKRRDLNTRIRRSTSSTYDLAIEPNMGGSCKSAYPNKYAEMFNKRFPKDKYRNGEARVNKIRWRGVEIRTAQPNQPPI